MAAEVVSASEEGWVRETYPVASSSTANLTPCTTVRCRSALTCCARWKATRDNWKSCDVFCKEVLCLGCTRTQAVYMIYIRAEHTSVACSADNFFKSSEPRFAIARVDSVKS